jgi:predicted nucleic acid-binding protein
MSPESFLLDTSAVIAMVDKESGAERVRQILRNEHTLIPWVVLLEVSYITRREQGKAEADYRYCLLKHFPSMILWDVSEPILLTAARYKSSHRISFADSLILAYAFQNKARLVHKDPEFESMEGILLETLPYK